MSIVRNTPEEFENGGLFLRLGVHSNPSRIRSFSKTLFKPEEFEKASFVLMWTENILKTKFFKKQWCYRDHHNNSPARVFLKRKSKMTGDCCVFKLLRRTVDGKQLMCFQSETSVFKFLRRRVAGVLDFLKVLSIYSTQVSSVADVFRFPCSRFRSSTCKQV